MDLQLCETITNAFGPSGFEGEVAEAVQAALPCASQRDAMQNVYAPFAPLGGKPVVLLDAHMDEVGFMVQSITSNGLVKLVPLGGWVEYNVPAHIFHIRTRNGSTVRAVTASKPPHFLSAAERQAPLSLDSILLDAGVSSREQALALGIEPGCPVAPEAAFSYNEATGFALGKAFDCRLGCACLVELARALHGARLAVDAVAAFSTQEEVGLRGAKVTAEKLRPRLAICLEGTPADDGFTPAGEAQGVLGAGVQIRHRDGSMVAHPGFVEFARTVAQKDGIPHQLAVRTGGGTNGGSIHLAPGGVPTLVLGIPVRYAHTHYGYSAAADYDAALALAGALLRALTPQVVDELCPVVAL